MQNNKFKKVYYSPFEGDLQVVTGCEAEICRVYISGDPKGLKSLAQLLIELANVDQTQLPSLPEVGASEHIHLEPDRHLGQISLSVVISRLDDKSGLLDETFKKATKQTKDKIVHLW